MFQVEEKEIIIQNDIGSWFYAYTLLETTELEKTPYQIYKVTTWLESKNNIVQHILRKNQEITIPKAPLDIALIVGIQTSASNTETSKSIDENFYYSEIIDDDVYLYGTTHRPGKKNEKEIADDMVLGDKTEEYFSKITDKKGKFIDFSKIIDLKNKPQEIFKIMRSKLNNFATSDLDNVLNKWIDCFSQKVVSSNNFLSFRECENETLTAKFKEHQSTKKLIKRILKQLQIELTKDTVKGDIYQLLLEFKKGEKHKFYQEMHWGVEENDRTPNFSTLADSVRGLRILINDVWGYDIEIRKYVIESKRISGEIKFTFFDNFGLDDDDIKKFGNGLNGDGFKAWYFLQHYSGFCEEIYPHVKRAYQPFITKVVILKEFSFDYEC